MVQKAKALITAAFGTGQSVSQSVILREGQLETTHANAYRVGHYHTKHCHAAVVSLSYLLISRSRPALTPPARSHRLSGFPASTGTPWPPPFKCAYFFNVCLHTGFTSRL